MVATQFGTLRASSPQNCNFFQPTMSHSDINTTRRIFGGVRRLVDHVRPTPNRIVPAGSNATTATDPIASSSTNSFAPVLVDLPVECEMNNNLFLGCMVGTSASARIGTAQETAATASGHSLGSQEEGLLAASAQSIHSSTRGVEFRKFSRSQRIFRALFHVWDIPLTQRLFSGKREIQQEQLRQENCSHWVIHPCSRFRLVWDLIMFFILSVDVILLPVAIAFYDDSIDPGWLTLNIITDIFFVIDIVLNFWTGLITNDNFVILELRRIRWTYFRCWLWVDLIAVCPLDYIALGLTNIASVRALLQAARILRVFRLARLLSLLRLLRVVKFMKNLSKWEEFISTTKSIIHIANLILVMFLIAHWSGCIQFLVPYLEDFPHNSWVTINRLQNETVFTQYTWSLFKAGSHMICIGYGRFPPQNTTEVWMTIISMIIGATFYALFIAHISTLVYTRDSSSRQYDERIKQVKDYMTYRRLPVNIREEVRKYYYHKYHGHLFNEEGILKELSHPLRERIISHNCQDLVNIVPFFANADPNFITSVVTRLTFEVFLPGDFIIHQGTFGSKMYFIQHGKVDIITSDGKIASNLCDGAYFGEICLLMRCRRVSSAQAVTLCDLYALSNEDYQHVLDMFPHMRGKMEDVARERLAVILNLMAPDNEQALHLHFYQGSRDVLHSNHSQHQAQPEDMV